MKRKLLLLFAAFALCANLMADGFQTVAIGAVQSNIPAHRWQLAGESRWHVPGERINALAGKTYTVVFQPALAPLRITVTAGRVTTVQ